MIFLKARYYDPSIERFLSKDTYLGTLDDPLSQNLYAYVGNNPVLYVDPSGHLAICSYDPKQQTAELRQQLEPEDLSLWERIKLWGKIKWTEQPVILINFAPNTNISFLGGTGNATQTAANLGKSYGKFGTVVENPGIKITGFSKHGVNQAITRGVTTNIIKNTIDNPTVVLSQRGGNAFAYISDDAVVVLDKAGKVITTYGNSYFDTMINQVLKEVMK